MPIRYSLSILASLLVLFLCSCGGKPSSPASAPPPVPIVVYCGVDEPYASQVFADFKAKTGIPITPVYDVESFKSARLVNEGGILKPYFPPTAADIPDQYKDPNGYWTGVGLRARVLAIGD